ncbi:MAG: response regulator [Fidelibacterota bacterium]
MKFLIVEDNPHNTVYAQFLLKKLKYENIAATSGEEALDLLQTEKVDCMLVDINLGMGMSGVEFLKNILQDNHARNVPMIAVTAYCTTGDKEKFLKEGFDDFLAKPYTFKELKQVLNRTLQLNDYAVI